jgi:hypothetical protein
MTIPDKRIYPRTNDPETVYLNSVIKNPNIIVGDYTMYNDFVSDPMQFEKNNVLYHYPVNNDRLIIGRFCSVACGARFIFTSANHTLRSLSTYPFPIFFAEIRKHGNSGKHLSGGERSMLSGFQEAAQKVQEKDEYALVPFFLFYDTVHTFLDGAIRRVIERCVRAAADGNGLEARDVDVLKLLYLVRYLRANLDNIVILIADDLRIDKVVYARIRPRFAGPLAEPVKGFIPIGFWAARQHWSDACADALAQYGRIPELPQQEEFYARKIKTVGTKMFVIISDAFRYEVAVSLAEQLRRETQSKVELSSCEAIFPTITKFGMAALLPHQLLTAEFNNGMLAVLADGHSTRYTYLFYNRHLKSTVWLLPRLCVLT